jgi:predicted GNAT superfamily acetyltransferase
VSITYRELTARDDLEAITDLESVIWGLSPRDVVPPNVFHAQLMNGGLLLAAYDGDSRPIGLCFAVPAFHEKQRYLWSHMMGVHPDYRHQGVGYEIKQLQRQWAAARGYDSIRWTFDPLQSVNAYFNLGRLGARPVQYHIDYYGPMHDAINAGMPSDRLEVSWPTRPGTAQRPVKPDTNSAIPLLQMTDRQVVFDEAAAEQHPPFLTLSIPQKLEKLKTTAPDVALQWRLAMREALCWVFDHDYALSAIVRTEHETYFVAQQPEPWYLYVLRCGDGSLYTGIAKDLDRRIATHQRGKGAAYTRSRLPVRLLGCWCYNTRRGAAVAEVYFKRLKRAAKLELITTRDDFMDGQFFIID